MKNPLFRLSSITLMILMLSLLHSCSFKIIRGESSYDKLEKLTDWMTGSFSSKAQSLLDTNFYNIHLEMVRIWPDRNDGVWLYVEQAASWNLDKPYRQRVYHLTEDECGGVYKSEIYTIKDPLRFAGEFVMKEPLQGLSPDSLELKHGCHIQLVFEDCEFKGRTNPKSCKSELNGASYATSEVSITKYELQSWDRGFDVQGQQVWGAVKGPYIFKKIRNLPLSKQ
jgi:hypothetical protein